MGNSNSEVGHAKNVANFQKLIACCEIQGATYNPSNALIELAELSSFHQQANAAIQKVHDKKNALSIYINERQASFQKLDAVATSVVNLLTVGSNDPKIIADARTILRRIRGEASKPKTIENLPGQEIMEPHSNSQQSYDKRIDHFTALISLVNQVSAYEPNEAQLQMAGLNAYLAELIMTNTNVINGHTQHSNAMHERNQVLYNKLTGLLNRAKLVKTYFKGIFGAKSDQYKQVAHIEFRDIKP